MLRLKNIFLFFSCILLLSICMTQISQASFEYQIPFDSITLLPSKDCSYYEFTEKLDKTKEYFKDNVKLEGFIIDYDSAEILDSFIWGHRIDTINLRKKISDLMLNKKFNCCNDKDLIYLGTCYYAIEMLESNKNEIGISKWECKVYKCKNCDEISVKEKRYIEDVNE